jgi:hypothetical protein
MAQKEIRIDRVPPQDTDMERALLGSMLYQPEGTKNIITKAIDIGVIPEIFYKGAHRDICTTIFNLYDRDEPVDLLSVTRELQANGKLALVGDVAYLEEMIDSVPVFNAANFTTYARIVQQEKLRRQVIEVSRNAHEAMFHPLTEVDTLIDQVTSDLKCIKELYHHNNGNKTSWTGTELMDMDIPEPIWLVRNYIPEGLCLFAGSAKTGKSWIALQLAVGVASDTGKGFFLGIEPIENFGNVLYLALEDSLYRLKSRLLYTNPEHNKLPNFEAWVECPRLSEGGLVKIENWVKNKEKPRLVVIDVLEMVRAMPDKYKSAYTQDYEELGKLKKLCHKYNISIMVVDHKRKQEAEDVMNTIHGSVGKQGAPDGLLVLTRPRKERIGTISRTGKDFEEESDMAVEFDVVQNGGFKIIGDASEVVASEQVKEIIKLFEDINEPLTSKRIADEIGINYSSVRVTVRRLCSRGTLKQWDKGTYILNQKYQENKNP